MPQVTLPYSLTANSDEDVNQLMADLIALRDGTNNVDGSQIVDGSVGTLELAAGAVTVAKLATALQPLVAAPAHGNGTVLRAFASTQAVGGSGWQTISFPYGFTMTSVLVCIPILVPVTNGAAMTSWSMSGFSNTSVSMFIFNNLAQNITLRGLVFGT